MSRPTLFHEQDRNLGWHRPLDGQGLGPFHERPTLHLRAGVSRGTARLVSTVLLPSLGEFPHSATLIDARWRPLEVTSWDLIQAAATGLQRWLEGYDQG